MGVYLRHHREALERKETGQAEEEETSAQHANT